MAEGFSQDAWWACEECCMNLDLDGIRVTRAGLEFPPEDVDDGFDTAEAKKAAAKDSQPNKSNEEAVDIVDDVEDDSVDDESKTKQSESILLLPDRSCRWLVMRCGHQGQTNWMWP